MALPPVIAVDLMLTYDCNCRCPYCFVKDSGKDISMSAQILDRAMDWIAIHSGSAVDITLLGGEPTLMPHLIERAVYRAGTWRQLGGIQMRFNMTTNALNIDESLARNLAKWGIRYLLSIDGTGDRHNRSRPAIDYADPFKHLFDKFDMLKAYQPNMAGRLTVMPENVYWLDEDLHKLHQMGFESFIVSPATGIEWSDEELDIFIKQMTAFATSRSPDKYGKLKPRLEPVDGEVQGRGTWGCSAGRGRCAIDPRGLIFGCARMARIDSKEGLIFGSLDSDVDPAGNILKFQDDSYSSRPAKCITCELRERCIGGCPSVNYDASGSLVLPAPDECRFAFAFDQIITLSHQSAQLVHA